MLHLHRYHHRALPLSQGRLHFISERIAVQSGAVAPDSKYSCLTSNTPQPLLDYLTLILGLIKGPT